MKMFGFGAQDGAGGFGFWLVSDRLLENKKEQSTALGRSQSFGDSGMCLERVLADGFVIVLHEQLGLVRVPHQSPFVRPHWDESVARGDDHKRFKAPLAKEVAILSRNSCVLGVDEGVRGAGTLFKSKSALRNLLQVLEPT